MNEKTPYCILYLPCSILETDGMNIVHHANHAKYLERGNPAELRLIGSGYKKIVEMGLHFPVIELNCKYNRPIPFDAILAIETKITDLTLTRLKFEYKIHLVDGDVVKESELRAAALDGKPHLKGFTEHCCVNNASKPVPIPDEMRKTFEKYWAE